MFEIFPRVRFWGMGLWDIKSQQSMDLARTYITENRLTSLDLIGNNLHVQWEDRLKLKRQFHAFLCQSPHLIHLRASGTTIHCNSLDPDLSLPFRNIDSVLPETQHDINRLPLLWACRRLQTLHIQSEMDRWEDNRSWRLIYG